MTTTADLPPGLKGVVVADTSVGDVRGDEGFFHYRQYAAPDLARARHLEDVWALLLDGALPDAPGGRAFAAELGRRRALPSGVADVLRALVAVDHDPVSATRTAISVLGGALGMRALLDGDDASRRADALALLAAIPTAVAAVHRLRSGLEPAGPPEGTGIVAGYLTMVRAAAPSPAEVAALERYLVLTADHGFNASTFTARVVASTGADLGACLTAAFGALSGPLHGGAPSRVLDLLDDLATADGEEAVRAALVARLDRRERLMGFGHAVYRTEDPRAAMLREEAVTMGGARLELALAVERQALALLAERSPGRVLATNVEFWAALVLEGCGLPRDLFTPTFGIARTAGWCAHVLEQTAAAVLIRPAARYVGELPPAPVPSL